MGFFSCFFFFFLVCWPTTFVLLQLAFWRFRNVIPDTPVALELPIILDIVHLSSGELCLLGLLWCFRVWGLHLPSSFFFIGGPHNFLPAFSSSCSFLTVNCPCWTPATYREPNLAFFQWPFYLLLSYHCSHFPYMGPRFWEGWLTCPRLSQSISAQNPCNAGATVSIPGLEDPQKGEERIGCPLQNLGLRQ